MIDNVKMEKNQEEGSVFEIERFAINDGQGIRIVVFLQGCPLRCLWCANPESQESGHQLMWWNKKCMGCKRCVHACLNHALSWSDKGISVNRKQCVDCGKCEDACNSEAITRAGRKLTVDAVMAEVDKDASYYENTGGGVTFSGGEPFAQHQFLHELLVTSKRRGYHTAIETCGHAAWRVIEKNLPYIDAFLYDLKCMDNDKHKAFTGVGNELIKENYARISNALNKEQKLMTRLPFIPGFNDDFENLGRVLAFVKQYNPQSRVDILPYHPLGIVKYIALNKEYRGETIQRPSPDTLEKAKMFFENEGFEVTIGG